jgi:hypothetical protein
LQKDPIGFSGGNLNLYGYTQNNPLIYTDPSGKECNVVGSTISGATAEGNTGQIVGGVIGSTAGAAAGAAAAGASIGGSIGTAVGIAVGSLGGLLTAGALGQRVWRSDWRNGRGRCRFRDRWSDRQLAWRRDFAKRKPIPASRCTSSRTSINHSPYDGPQCGPTADFAHNT